MIRFFVLSILGAAAVAIPAAAQGPDRISTDWGTFLFERDRGSTSGAVAAGPDTVFSAMRTILKDLGLKLEEDPARHEFGASRQRVVRRMGKEPISTYLSCGEGLTGPNADTWHIYYNMAVEIDPAAANKSRLGLMFHAEAVDVPNGRNDRVACATTGRLELEIIKRLRNAFPGTT